MLRETKKVLESLLGISIEEVNEDLISMLQEINFNDQKRNDVIKYYIEEVKLALNSPEDAILKYKNQLETNYFANVKLDNKTRYYNTAVNDDLSPTMYAFYFCDKTNPVLSDRVAAEMEAMQVEAKSNIYEEERNKVGRSSKNEIANFDKLDNVNYF